MARLSHWRSGLSIALLVALDASALAATPSPYYGRWTIDEADARFSAQGRPYRTIDIAPCGKDFCGVSVDPKGVCGATLFRFLTRHGDGTTTLIGHGKWGNAVQNVNINAWQEDKGQWMLDLRLGNGRNLGERSGNMPKFTGSYKRLGIASCRAR